MTKIVPLHDYILVSVVQPGKTEAGIYIPPSDTRADAANPLRGEVLAMGPTAFAEDVVVMTEAAGRGPSSILDFKTPAKVGDVVLFLRLNARPIDTEANQFLIPSKNIMAVVLP